MAWLMIGAIKSETRFLMCSQVGTVFALAQAVFDFLDRCTTTMNQTKAGSVKRRGSEESIFHGESQVSVLVSTLT